MVDGVMLLVDAREGPLPADPFRAAQGARGAACRSILVINKVDRPDARIAEVVDEVVRAVHRPRRRRAPDRVPDRLHQRPGRAGPRSTPSADGSDLKPLLRARCLEHIPAPTYDRRPSAPGARHQPRRLAVPRPAALCRVRNGTIKQGPAGRWCRNDGTIERVQDRRAVRHRRARAACRADDAGPGDIIAVAGIPEITIGETLADADDPRPLPPLIVDEPSLSMTVGINTSPLAGQDGNKLTARQVENRLARRSSSATCRSGSCPPSAPTPGRCRVAASCSSPCSSR